MDRRLDAGDGPHDGAPVALHAARQRFKPDRSPDSAVAALRPHVAAQRRNLARIAGSLNLAQDHLRVPDAVVEQGVNLRRYGSSRLPRRTCPDGAALRASARLIVLARRPSPPRCHTGRHRASRVLQSSGSPPFAAHLSLQVGQTTKGHFGC